MKITVPAAAVRHLGAPLVSAIAWSWRIRAHDADHHARLAASGEPFVFLLWHEVLLPLLWHHRGQGVSIVVSEAREGKYLGEYAERLGYRLLPGSSTRGGARALLGAMRALREGGVVAFTPDGPRGPRREIKRGIVRAAQKTGAAVLPVHAGARHAWRLHSWDRMVIPRPGTVVDVCYGAPFRVAPGPQGLEDGIARCARALQALESPGAS